MIDKKTAKTGLTGINRRTFLRSTAAISAGLIFPSVASAADEKNPDQINVALIGAGAEGQVLIEALTKWENSGIQFKAVCDIWENYSLKRISKTLQAYKHPAVAYVDYQEMLDKETDLDAVIVATPDFWHARHSIACLEKGLHVYCEKEMATNLEDAAKMVQAARTAGKLLQIGHQRRSNPRYKYCYDKFIKEANLLGRITTINGQWNRGKAACEDLGWSDKYSIDATMLGKYGFTDMKQFRNWRWYKGLGGGPIVDLGSHQIDIYAWFLDATPKSVMASGGVDYWTDHEWYDNVIAIYEFDTKNGPVRASYQTITTNSNGGYFEEFMGDEGTLEISESNGRGSVFREQHVPEEAWQKWVTNGIILEAGAKKAGEAGGPTDARESIPAAEYEIPVTMNDPYHLPHLKNFFDSIRGKDKLNCPGEIGYETAAMVLKVNEAVAAGQKLTFTPEDFKI